MSQENKSKNIIRLMQGDDSVDAPADAVKWVKNLYLTRGDRPSFVRRIVAVLQADLLPNRALAGERSASVAHTRQMFFTAGEFGIDLRITGSRKGLVIKGQILGDGVEDISVSLSGNDGSFEAKTDKTAMFEFANVPAGIYDLIFLNDQTEIAVESIEI